MLNRGYLLDNKGINVNTAFLKYTYEEYARLRQIPTPDELYRSIIDKDPIVEMWNCGRKGESGDMVVQLNDAIDNKSLAEKFKRIK